MNDTEYKKYLKKSDEGILSDNSTPIFIFSMANSQLLVDAIAGKFDLKTLAKIELRNRGLNKNGEFVGFKNA